MLSSEGNCWKIYVNPHQFRIPVYLDAIIRVYWASPGKDIYDNAIGWKNLLRPFTVSSSFRRNVKTLKICDYRWPSQIKACLGGSLSAIVSQLWTFFFSFFSGHHQVLYGIRKRVLFTPKCFSINFLTF